MLHFQLDSITEAPLAIFQTPNLDDLFMYDAISNEAGEYATIDTGDVITIQCLDGVYRTGEVYSYGLTYGRIFVNNRFYTAVITDDVRLHLRTASNTWQQTIYQIAEEADNALITLQGAA